MASLDRGSEQADPGKGEPETEREEPDPGATRLPDRQGSESEFHGADYERDSSHRSLKEVLKANPLGPAKA